MSCYYLSFKVSDCIGAVQRGCRHVLPMQLIPKYLLEPAFVRLRKP